MQDANDVKVIEYDRESKEKKQDQNSQIDLSRDHSDDETESSSSSDSESGDTEIEKLDLEKLGNGYSDSNAQSSDDSDTESDLTDSTTDILKKDPLFQVLSEFFLSKNSQNVCDILEKINANLEKLIASPQK